jgi:hypothetical protein
MNRVEYTSNAGSSSISSVRSGMSFKDSLRNRFARSKKSKQQS